MYFSLYYPKVGNFLMNDIYTNLDGSFKKEK